MDEEGGSASRSRYKKLKISRDVYAFFTAQEMYLERAELRGNIVVKASDMTLSAAATSNSANSFVSQTGSRSQCLVRPSTAGDMAYVTSIYARFVSTSTATCEILAPDESEMLRRRQAVLDLDLPYLIAELEGYIVGYCYASQFRPREGYRYTVEDSIYVRPDCIGHGVGRMLLTQLIAECQGRGCHSMVACICGTNVSSVALHASHGFKQVGLLPEAGYKFGEWLRLVIMQRSLS